MLGLSWRKLVSDVEGDLKGFPDEDISKYEILAVVCAMRSFEYINK
jgi:hypothetical protein